MPARLATSFGSLQGALLGVATSSGGKPVAAPTRLSYPSSLDTDLRFPQRLHTAP